MATFRRFEDIQAWQKAREANKLIFKLSGTEKFTRDYTLKDQIRRASSSIMANIAEGFGRHSDKEFAHFLNIAHASAFEVQSHLYIALDLEYVEEDVFRDIYDRMSEIARMLYALSKHLRQ